MNEANARLFLQCLNAKHVETKSDGKWLRCSCPLARWNHKNGKDSNPSFALSLSDTEEPFFNCFSCNGGTAVELLQTIEMMVNTSDPELKAAYKFKNAHEILDNQQLFMVDLPEYEEFGAAGKKLFSPWPEEYLQSFVRAECAEISREYLFQSQDELNQFGQKCRGINEATCQRFDLRYDHSRGMVVFPYRDAFGRLAGMRGRSVVEHKHYDYTWNNVNNAQVTWFNEQVLENLPGWVVVCEGQFDAMRVSEGGWAKVLATMTAKPSARKLEKLLHAEGTILIPDNDETGDKTIIKYRDFHAARYHPFKVLKLPPSVKDADECSPLYLHDQLCELFY